MMRHINSLYKSQAEDIYEYYFGQFRLGLLKYIELNWNINLKEINEKDIVFGDLIFEEITEYCHLHGDIIIKKLIIRNKRDLGVIEISYKWFDEEASDDIKLQLYNTLDRYVKMYNFVNGCK